MAEIQTAEETAKIEHAQQDAREHAMLAAGFEFNFGNGDGRVGEQLANYAEKVTVPRGRLDQLIQCRNIQSDQPNVDEEDYMRGLYNGLEMAQAIMENRDPVYKQLPQHQAPEGEIPYKTSKQSNSIGQAWYERVFGISWVQFHAGYCILLSFAAGLYTQSILNGVGTFAFLMLLLYFANKERKKLL